MITNLLIKLYNWLLFSINLIQYCNYLNILIQNIKLFIYLCATKKLLTNNILVMKNLKSKLTKKLHSTLVESLSFHYHHYFNCDKTYVIITFVDGTIERFDFSDPSLRRLLNLNTVGSPCPIPIRYYHTFYNFERPIKLNF